MDRRARSTPSSAGTWLRLFLLVALPAVVVPLIRVAAQQMRQDPTSQVEHAVRALRAGYDDTARGLLTPLSERGNAAAQYWLADLYQSGLGVERDPQHAIDLLKRSASSGFVPAELRLGEIYLQGRLVLQDLPQAHLWLEKAAIAGDDVAQQAMSRIFEKGLGVHSDQTEAYAWAAVAATHGSGTAQRERDRILSALSPEQAVQGEARARQIEGLSISSESKAVPDSGAFGHSGEAAQRTTISTGQ